jgi:ATP-binding cassette, subfamily B, bacterial
MRGVGASTRIFELLRAADPPPPVPAPVMAAQEVHTTTAPVPPGLVELRGVRFRYPTRPDALILEHLDLVCKPGCAHCATTHTRATSAGSCDDV